MVPLAVVLVGQQTPSLRFEFEMVKQPCIPPSPPVGVGVGWVLLVLIFCFVVLFLFLFVLICLFSAWFCVLIYVLGLVVFHGSLFELITFSH